MLGAVWTGLAYQKGSAAPQWALGLCHPWGLTLQVQASPASWGPSVEPQWERPVSRCVGRGAFSGTCQGRAWSVSSGKHVRSGEVQPWGGREGEADTQQRPKLRELHLNTSKAREGETASGPPSLV